MKNKNLSHSLGIAIALYALTCFPPFGGTKGGCQSVGINATGTPPDASAMLDVSSTDKGLLIPRVSLTSTTDVVTIASPVTSLLVYNTNAAMTDGAVGYWYWNGAQWTQLGAGSGGGGTAWELLGNTGIIDGTNFLGTTDNAPLNFRVNNQKAGRIASTGPVFLGYQAGNSNTAANNTGVGYHALFSNTSGNNNTAVGYNAISANTTGVENTAVGRGALDNNTTGNFNTATGDRALGTNSTGIYNTASGWAALYDNTTGNYNTAAGRWALFENIIGNENTALGNQALQFNKGNYNTAIGSNAGFGGWATPFQDGTYNIFIGYNSGRNYPQVAGGLTNAIAIGKNSEVTASNQMILGGTGADAVKVGIGTTTPGFPLEVSGGVTIAAISQRYFTNTAALTLNSTQTPTVAIKANNAIWTTGGFYASSDKRSKENIVSRNPADDLSFINKLNPVKYNWIDRSKSSHTFEDGFIAQEVEQVLPEVINTNIEVIPNIMELVEKPVFESNQLRINLKKANEIKAGDVLKIITQEGKEHKWTVVSVNNNEITLNVESNVDPTSKIFVYGKEVNDFKTVDYNRIFTVGISAMQELSRLNELQQKRIDSQQSTIDNLQTTVGSLQTENKYIKSENISMQSDIQKLKSVVEKLTQKEYAASK